MRRLSAAVLCSLIGTWTIGAQEQSDAQRFRSGVELVQLDVSVLDDQRHPVRGLTAADFTVLENGDSRPIRAFTAVDIAARTTAPLPVWANDIALDVTTNQTAKTEGRLVVILMDRSIPASGGSYDAQKIALAAVDQLGPGDLAALVSTSGVYTPQNFTSDRSRLVQAIMQRDWSTESATAPWSLTDAADPRCFCGLCVLETMTRVSDALRDAPKRRKLLFFIGRGLIIAMGSQPGSSSAGCETKVKPARETLFNSLAVSGLTIHSIDPRGLFNVGDHTRASAPGGLERPGTTAAQGRLTALNAERNDVLATQHTLAVLPERTGGRTVVNAGAPAEKVADIFRESQAYYIIGFERDPSVKPDVRRSLSVKVARRDVRVYAQRQFIAQGQRAQPSRTGEGGSTSEAALTGLLPATGRALALDLAAFATPENDRANVRVTIDAGSFAREQRDIPLEVRTAVFDQSGRAIGTATQTSTLPPTSIHDSPRVDVPTQIDLPPGDYEVRVAVVDPATSVTASVFGQIVVPTFTTERLSLSDVVLETAAAVTPITARVFAPTDQVRAFLEIYQGIRRTDPIVPVTVRVRVVDAGGATAHDQSMAFTPTDFQQRRADCRIALPVAALRPGEYLLDITARAGDNSATRHVRFTIR